MSASYRIEFVPDGNTDGAFEPSAFSPSAFFESSNAWSSLAGDVSRAETIAWRRGMQGGGPLDLVAVTGQAEWSMKNDETNSAHTLGYYSPNNAACRSGWTRGVPIRVVATASGTDYVLWVGKLRTIDPIPGRYGPRLVRCVAYDCMRDLAENDVTGIAPQVSQTENALVAAIIAALPTAAQPAAVSYDSSLDTYPYALYNASSGVKAVSLLIDVAQSARAFIYPKADGALHVENRQTRSLKSVSYAFSESELDREDGLSVPTDLALIWNHVRTVTHPPTIDAAATTVLYALTAVQAIDPGDTVTIWGDYADPNNSLKLIGGTAQVTPIVATTDYMANAAADGTGANKTAQVSVVTSAFAATVKFEVTNNDAAKVYLVDLAGAPKLQLRGKGIRLNAPASFNAQTTQTYERLLVLDLPFQSDGAVAQDIASFVEAQYNALENQILSLAFLAAKSDALLTQALTREIGDIVTATETVTGVDGVEAVIQAIEMELLPGQLLHCRYLTAPTRGGGHPFVLDDLTYGVLDATDGTLGYA